MNKEELNKIISDEGDFHEWMECDIKCQIRRNYSLAWCGYIIIPNSYTSINYDRLYVHGGVTYQNRDDNGDMVVGFDCAHHGDIIPSMLELNTGYNNSYLDESIYRDKGYVINQVKQMLNEFLEVPEIKKQLNRNSQLNKILN